MTVKVSAVDIQKNFGRYQDMALAEPVTVTKYGRDSIVMLSVREYNRLRRRERQALAVEELSEAEIEAIGRAEVPAEHAGLDRELP